MIIRTRGSFCVVILPVVFLLVSFASIPGHAQSYEITWLIETLRFDVDELERAEAARALGEKGEEGFVAIPYLTEAMKDEDPGVRLRSAITLGKFGPVAQEAVPALISVLDDIFTGVRAEAAFALGKIGVPVDVVVPNLIETLNDPAWFVRMRAARGLASMGPQTLPELIQALQEENPLMRQAAAFALGEMGADAWDAVPWLTDALIDEDARVRELADEALLKIRGF